MTLAIVLWILPSSLIISPTCVMDVEASAITLQFDHAVSLTPGFTARRAVAKRFDSVSSSMFQRPGDGTDIQVTLEGNGVELNHLELEPPGDITLAPGQGELTANLHGKHVSVELRVSGANAHLMYQTGPGGTSGQIEFNAREFPEPVQLVARRRDAVPVELRLDQPKPWKLPTGLRPAGIWFAQQSFDQGSPGEVVSAILGGQVRVLDVNSTRHLENGDNLAIKGLEIIRFEVSHESDFLHAHIEARARSVRVGPKGFERDIMPTLLESASKDDTFKQILAGLVALWSLTWGLRKLLIESKS